MTLCLYAIVSSTPTLLHLRGLRNERLELIRAGNVCAVVGRVSRPLQPTPANMRAYHNAIGRLAAVVPAVLPVRFGTTFQFDTEIVGLLRERAAAFRTVLTRVRGRVQMTVRLVTGEERLPGTNAGSSASDRSSGAAYLRSRAGHARRLVMWPPCVELRRVAIGWIRAELIEERQGVVSVYHLIPRRAAAPYRRAVEGELSGLRAKVTGPFPPFAFADPLGAASESAPVVARQRFVRG